MLKQANGLLFDQLTNHITQDCADSIETLISLANVCETGVIKQYLLNNKDCHGLG